MPFVASMETKWLTPQFVKVPPELIVCEQLDAKCKILLVFLINQIGMHPVSHGVIDRCLGIHRTTRARCLVELKALGFIKGTDSHFVLCDPIPVLTRLSKQSRLTDRQVGELRDYCDVNSPKLEATTPIEQRDFMKEASDSWNRYRPKDYQKIRRISSELVKAVDNHMRSLGVKAHDYDEFFSILKSGVERDPWWSKVNSAKTLQSITGIGSPTDKKKANVFKLFNDGIEAPSTSLSEDERNDTIVYPASYRNVIDEYDAAQTAYSQACSDRSVTDDSREYIIRTEEALRQIGLDPARFKFKFGISDWPTSTPEPAKSRIVNWTYDDEYINVY